MKHLTLVILLALAPLSWGEVQVFYCLETKSTFTSGKFHVDNDSDRRFSVGLNRKAGILKIGEPYGYELPCTKTECRHPDAREGFIFAAGLSQSEAPNPGTIRYFGL
jgi:hypothetical protein